MRKLLITVSIATDAHRIYGQRDDRHPIEGYDGALAEHVADQIREAREAAVRERDHYWRLAFAMEHSDRTPVQCANEMIARQERACEAARREERERFSDGPFSILDTLDGLAKWARHLMSDHDCDGDKYEEVDHLISAAGKHAAAIRAKGEK